MELQSEGLDQIMFFFQAAWKKTETWFIPTFRKSSSLDEIPLAALACFICILGGLKLFPMVTKKIQKRDGQKTSGSGILFRYIAVRSHAHLQLSAAPASPWLSSVPYLHAGISLRCLMHVQILL